MIISIASGKGGTGKTTLATNLAVALKEKRVQLLDCDVEEPNAHLFLKPTITETLEVSVEVPEIDSERCTYCGQCQDICQFNAIAIVPEAALTFPELCHSCKGCFLICPEQAISEKRRLVGTVERGHCDGLEFVHGRLRVGEAMAPPLIRKVREETAPHKTVIIDAPPGTSCPVIAAVKGSDFVLLVTEPTPFGLNDLELAVGAMKKLGLAMGIVINRADMGDGRTHHFAEENGIPVLLEIPFDRKVAEAYARGKLLVDVFPNWRDRMESLFTKITELAAKEAHLPKG